MSIDERAISAARNNADLYEAVFSAHGLPYERRPYAFVAGAPPPPYYSDLTILAPGNTDAIATELAQLAEMRQSAVGLKDSFEEMDLHATGVHVLFDAGWIWRRPKATKSPKGWDIVRRPDDLEAWEIGWRQSGSPTNRRMFPASMLGRSDVVFLGFTAAGEYQKGCIANVSGDCVGLSNVFSRTPSKDVFFEAADAVSALASGLAVVGYEAGEVLGTARAAGFDVVGRLRVLSWGPRALVSSNRP